MRGPLILAATVLVGGTLLFGLSRFGGADATVLPQDAPPAPLAAAPVDLTLPVMTVYKSPTCGCCTAWIDHLLAAGFRIEAVDTDDLTAVKVAMGVPLELGSCHTATIDGLLIEGHVPARDITDFLAERPEGVRGLAVPGMPIGSPGMEVAGRAADPYDVVAFGTEGSTTVYRAHRPER